MTSVVCLIPARGGSKRIPRKNLKLLNGHPLVAYTIAAAKESGIFGGIYVSTEDAEIADVARRYGASVIDRPRAFALDESPDEQWVRHALATIGAPEAFALLRVTSPFRSAATIREAWRIFSHDPEADSLRAVAPARQHPLKCWSLDTGSRFMRPFVPGADRDQPHAHSRPTQSLPPAYAQTAGMEMAWSRTVLDGYGICGYSVLPYVLDWPETIDINTEADFAEAEMVIERGLATLPVVEGVRV